MMKKVGEKNCSLPHEIKEIEIDQEIDRKYLFYIHSKAKYDDGKLTYEPYKGDDLMSISIDKTLKKSSEDYCETIKLEKPIDSEIKQCYNRVTGERLYYFDYQLRAIRKSMDQVIFTNNINEISIKELCQHQAQTMNYMEMDDTYMPSAEKFAESDLLNFDLNKIGLDLIDNIYK
ncbi:hypothetical protein A3Q56_03118 [Intoshia linei]|uniref:Uncharacterized protein n=1 Tax=Intoshia linei TaxID=1819745 RepID=A0A177B659_9BILA|nr:hypothetical protein A3Q56_03118 [Intoshia linei]